MLFDRKSKSLYQILGVSFFVLISLILVIQATFNYYKTKKQLEKTVIENVNVSSFQLKNTLISFMESYHVFEYEAIIEHEMSHKDLLAIVIKDYITGKVIGEEYYLTGVFRNSKSELVTLDIENINKIDEIKRSSLVKETKLVNLNDEEVGSLIIYGTNRYVNEELDKIILENLVISFFVYSLIFFALYLIIKAVLINPIENIIKSLTYKSKDKLIFNQVNEARSKEFSFLSSSINTMTNQIEQSHRELKESEAKWQFAVEGNGDGLWEWNVKTNEVFFSRKWKEMLGFNEDEIKNCLEEWENRVHPDDLENTSNDIKAYLNGEIPYYSNEHRLKCKNGSYKWILDRGVITERNAQGEPLKLIGTHSDIDKRKEYEFKMKQALIVYENTDEGIMITDVDNIIIDVNPAFEKTTGYSKKEIIGHKPSILRSNIHQEDFYKNMWDDIDNKGFWQGEITNKNKEGKLYEEYLSINSIKNDDGYVSTYIGIFSDISVIKQQEKLLLQQSRTSAIGEMIGNIAHQWRQPLSAISAASTGMKLQLEMNVPVSKETTIDIFDKINEQTQHLSRTIEDFRGFFTGDLSQVVEFNISEPINKVNELTKDAFNNNFIKVRQNIPEDINLQSNKNLLIQVLLNIYNNALDVLKEKTDDRYFFVTIEKQESHLIIQIRDSGGGIPEEFMEKIFDPYFTTKHQSQGTGIGLYMSHQITVKQLKGHISCKNVSFNYDNRDLIGAEFLIELPLDV